MIFPSNQPKKAASLSPYMWDSPETVSFASLFLYVFLILLSHFTIFLIDQRRHAHDLLKDTDKISGIAVPDLLTDFIDRIIGGFQQRLGPVNLKLCQKNRIAFSHNLKKKPAHIARAHVAVIRHLFQGRVFVFIVMYILEDLLDDLAVGAVF